MQGDRGERGDPGPEGLIGPKGEAGNFYFNHVETAMRFYGSE